MHDKTKTAIDFWVPNAKRRTGLPGTFESWSWWINIAVIVFAALVLVGWASDLSFLKRLVPGQPIIHSATSICLILSGLALLLLRRDPEKRWSPLIGRGLAVIVVAASALTFAEDVSGLDWNLNLTLWQPHADAAGLTFPGPMSPVVSLNFLFIGLSLLFMPTKPQAKYFVYQAFAVAASLLSLMTVIAYAAGLPGLCLGGDCIRMPASESVTYTALCFSILFSRPDEGAISIFTAETMGGSLVRRISLAFLALPILFCIKTAGERSGLFDQAFGWALVAVLLVVAIACAIGWNAATLDKIESSRIEAQRKLIVSGGEGDGTNGTVAAGTTAKAGRTGPRTARIVTYICPECQAEYGNVSKTCTTDGATLVERVDDPLIGTVFAERYQIECYLGAGGMSTVYKAKHLFLNKAAAIKLMHPSGPSDPLAVKRFLQEARAASALNQTNLITVYDFGETQNGEPFLVMDYVPGTNLSKLLAQQGRLSVQRTIDIMAQAINGLAHAHDKGIIHRDLKPSNIMLTKTDGRPEQVKIVDFGVAKILPAEGRDMQMLTQTGEIFGSPMYMSPEQCMSGPIDARSDIYALGCVMFECLAGFPAFESENFWMVINRQMSDDPTPFPEDVSVPEWIQEVIFRALHKDPNKRYQSVVELKERLLAGESASLERKLAP